MMTPTKSSVVLVAGSALKDLQQIEYKIYSLAVDMQMSPYVVIRVFTDNEMVPDAVRYAHSPPLVNLQVLHFNYILK